MNNGYHIILENSLGCEIDGTYAADEKEINGAVTALCRQVDFSPGDVVRIVEAAVNTKRIGGRA